MNQPIEPICKDKPGFHDKSETQRKAEAGLLQHLPPGTKFISAREQYEQIAAAAQRPSS